MPLASRPRRFVATDVIIDIGVQCLKAASYAEELAIAAAPESLLQEASAAGLRLRGCFLSVNFPALMRRLASISIREPEFLCVAEILVHAAASACPSSSVHSYCCSLALAAAGAGMHGGNSAVSDAACRALLVHVACFGGGSELWHHRIKGGPSEAYSMWARAWEPSQFLPMALYCRPYSHGTTGTILEAQLLGAKTLADITTDISQTELRVCLYGQNIITIPLDPSEVDGQRATASFDGKRRRLRIKFPGVRMPRHGSL